MIGELDERQADVSRRKRWILALAAIAVLAVPTISLTRPSPVRADDPKAPVKETKQAQPELQDKGTTTLSAPSTYTTPAKPQPVAPPKEEFIPPLADSEKKLLAALESKSECQFAEMPLGDVVDFLSELHSIPIKLDGKGLAEAGVASDTPITLKLKDIKLESLLRHLLRDLDLDFLIKDEVLLVTSQEVSENELITRTYPVKDLISDQTGKNFSPLIQTITTTVRPQTWDDVGGPASISPLPETGSITISHQWNAHREILELLRSLRKARELNNQ